MGTVPSASHPLTTQTTGARDPAVHRDNNISEEFASATKQCLIRFVFLVGVLFFFNSLCDGLAAPGTSLAACIGNAGKGKVVFSFLKAKFLKTCGKKKKEKRRGEK